MKYNDYDSNHEDPFFYTENDNISRAYNNKYFIFKRRTLVTAVVVGVITLIASFLLTLLVAELSVKKVERQYKEELAGYKTELIASIMSEMEYNYDVRNGELSLGAALATKMVDCVVEVYCYQSASSDAYNATATAMIINNEGYMITNAHVVTYESKSFFGDKRIINKYAKIECFFKNDNVGYVANVVSYDSERDLALIKFESLPSRQFGYVTFAKTESVMMGDSAIVIGNAEGLGISVTTGVVSNSIMERSGVEYIQTDCAINPGNSGGPLFNSTGYCLGVVTSKISSASNEGLGFAITADTVIDYINACNERNGTDITFNLFIL